MNTNPGNIQTAYYASAPQGQTSAHYTSISQVGPREESIYGLGPEATSETIKQYRGIISVLMESLGRDVRDIETMFGVPHIDDSTILISNLERKGLFTREEAARLKQIDHPDFHDRTESQYFSKSSANFQVNGVSPFGREGQTSSHYFSGKNLGMTQSTHTVSVLNSKLSNLEGRVSPRLIQYLKGCDFVVSQQGLLALESEISTSGGVFVDEQRFVQVMTQSNDYYGIQLAQLFADRTESTKQQLESERIKTNDLLVQLNHWRNQANLDQKFSVKITESMVYKLDRIEPNIRFNGGNLEAIFQSIDDRIIRFNSDLKSMQSELNNLRDEKVRTSLELTRVIQESSKGSDQILQKEAQIREFLTRTKKLLGVPSTVVGDVNQELPILEELIHRIKSAQIASTNSQIGAVTQTANAQGVTSVDTRRTEELERTISQLREQVRERDNAIQTFRQAPQQKDLNPQSEQQVISLRNELANYEGKVKTLESQLQQATQHIIMLQTTQNSSGNEMATIQDLQNKLNGAQNYINSITADCSAKLHQAQQNEIGLKSQMNALLEQMQLISTENQKYKQELQSSSTQSINTTVTREQKGESFTQSQADRPAVQQATTGATGESGEIVNLRKLVNDYEIKLREADNKIQSIEKSSKEVQSKLIELQQTSTVPQRNSEVADSGLRDIKAELKTSQMTVETLKVQLQQAEVTIQGLKTQITNYEVTIKELRSQLTQAETNGSTASTKLTAAETSIVTLKTQITTAESNITSLKTELQRLSGELQAKTQENLGLQTQMQQLIARDQEIQKYHTNIQSEYHNKTIELQQTAINLQTFKQNLDKEIAEMNTQKAHAESMLKEANSKIAFAETKMQEINQLRVETDKKLAQLDDEQKKFTQSSSNSASQVQIINQLKTELDATRTEKQRFETEYSNLQTELQKVKREHSAALQGQHEEQNRNQTLLARLKEAEKAFYDQQNQFQTQMQSVMQSQMAASNVSQDKVTEQLTKKLQDAGLEIQRLAEYAKLMQEKSTKAETSAQTVTNTLNQTIVQRDSIVEENRQLKEALKGAEAVYQQNHELHQQIAKYVASGVAGSTHTDAVSHIAASNVDQRELEELRTLNIKLQEKVQELFGEVTANKEIEDQNNQLNQRLESMQSDNEMMARALEEINDKIERGEIILVNDGQKEDQGAAEDEDDPNQVRIDEDGNEQEVAANQVHNMGANELLTHTSKELRNIKVSYEDLKKSHDELLQEYEQTRLENEQLREELIKIVQAQEEALDEGQEERQDGGQIEGQEEGQFEDAQAEEEQIDERSPDEIIEQSEEMIELLKRLTQEINELRGAYIEISKDLLQRGQDMEENGLNYAEFVKSAEGMLNDVKNSKSDREQGNLNDFDKGLRESVELYDSEKQKLIRRIQIIQEWIKEDDAGAGQGTERGEEEANQEGVEGQEGEEGQPDAEGEAEQAQEGEDEGLTVEKLVELLLITLQLIDSIRATATTEDVSENDRLSAIVDSINKFEQMGDSGEGNFELATILQKIVDNKREGAEEEGQLQGEEEQGQELAHGGEEEHQGEGQEEGQAEGQEEVELDYETLKDNFEKVLQLLEERENQVEPYFIKRIST
jgi:chromosome segregation ATPase